MKKLLAVLLALVLMIGLVAHTSPASATERFVFSSSNPGGTWYTISGGLIVLFNQELGNLYAMDMIASGGSVENTRRMALGDADFTIAYDYHMYEAYTGTGILQGRPSSAGQFMFFVNGQGASFVSLAGTGINTVADLNGRRVSLGSPGSGASDNSRRVISALGMSVTESEAGFADSARQLQDGLVDAIGVGGHPASGVVELSNARDILVVPFTDEELAAILEAAPYYSVGVLPANIYRGQNEEVKMPWYSNYIVVNENVSEQVVYDALTVFFSDEGREFLANVHRNFETMSMGEEASERLNIPFHPGAVRFFNENPQFK